MGDFSMKDLQQLDAFSYDEVDKIILQYEELRGALEYRLKKRGSLKDPATYDAFDEILAELSQTRDVKKRRAILAQIKAENCSQKEAIK